MRFVKNCEFYQLGRVVSYFKFISDPELPGFGPEKNVFFSDSDPDKSIRSVSTTVHTSSTFGTYWAAIQRRGSILSWIVFLSVMAQIQLQLISPFLR